MGTALLAGVGLKLYPDFNRATEMAVVAGAVFEPDHEAHRSYNKLFPIYKQLYLDTKHHFQKLVEMDLPQGWVTKGNSNE